MSIAEKLYHIGKSLSPKVIREMLRIQPLGDASYIVIDFIIDSSSQVTEIKTHQKSIPNERCFYTQKVGGSGEGIYYLYPNIEFKKDVPLKLKKEQVSGKYRLIVNTLENMMTMASESNQHILQNILDQATASQLLSKLESFEKADYRLIVTVNDQTLSELMPEVWENYYQNPCQPFGAVQPGQDAMDGEWHEEVGFNPNVKIFTMDNYHDALKPRMSKHLPLSQKSARYIRFGWQFAYENLLYRFNGLQYVILPSLAISNPEKLFSV